MEPYVLDRRSILDRLAGDEEIFAVMVDMYLQDLDNCCDQLTSPLQAGDAVTLQREAHTVKGMLASFSDDAGAQAAYQVEQQAKRGELAGLAEPIAALQARLREVGAVLQASTA